MEPPYRSCSPLHSHSATEDVEGTILGLEPTQLTQVWDQPTSPTARGHKQKSP